jgi:magnesium transporter
VSNSREESMTEERPIIEKPVITVIDYSETEFEEKQIDRLEDLLPYKTTDTVTWINVRGPVDSEVVSRLGAIFSLHPLTVDDIKTSDQRPKTEDMIDYIFLLSKMFYEDQKRLHKVGTEQISIVLARHFVLSFEEGNQAIFEPIREKLRKYKGRIRKMGTDYLTYRLLDAIIDSYFGVLEKIEERMTALEERVIYSPRPEALKAIHTMRLQMTLFVRTMWPMREAISGLARDEYPVITKATAIYFRDVYDHAIQIIETMETDRDILAGILDIYMTSISNRMNEIMKVLTIIATIFMPMTFLAGVYGMNFKYLPELEWRWAYPAFWVVIVMMGVFMFFYFRRKKWM